MTCPPGCLREKGHKGFHTTHPVIAKNEDSPLRPGAHQRMMKALKSFQNTPMAILSWFEKKAS